MKWLAALLILSSSTLALAQTPGEAPTTAMVSGTVLIEDRGTLYIHLVDEEQFKIPFTGTFEVIVQITESVIDDGFVEFEFGEVPVGRYGIRVFVDTNENQELDRGLFGPREPWGMSWQVNKLFRIPNFPDIAFDLVEDRRGLQIDTR